MTRKNRQDSKNVDLLDALLQKYEDASAKVQSHRTVIKAYENIPDISVATEIVSARQSQLLRALDQLASTGGKVLTECTIKIQKLEELNRNLREENRRICSDFERLKLEFQRQIGVVPKAMQSNHKEKEQQEQDSSNNNPRHGTAEKNPKAKRRGAPKGHR